MDWPEDVALSFNVSPIELSDQKFEDSILQVLAETGLPPRRLEIELTESANIADLAAVRETLTSLRSAGIRIALDDFGTGYSSFYHLLTLPLDKVKIDGSFVRAVDFGKTGAAIVQAVTSIGDDMHLMVTAEGIENRAQCDWLRTLGCQRGQGCLFGRAVPAAEAGSFFLSRSRK